MTGLTKLVTKRIGTRPKNSGNSMNHSGTTSHLATRVGLNGDATTTAIAIPTTTNFLPTVTWNVILNQVYGTSEVR